MSVCVVSEAIFDCLLEAVSNSFLHCEVHLFFLYVIFGEILWNYSDIPFLIKPSFTCFGIHWWFSNATIHPKIVTRKSTVKKSFPFSPTCLFIPSCLLSEEGFMDFYFIQWVIIPLFILMFRSPKIWPVVVLSNGLLCPFDLFPWFFENFLTFCKELMSQCWVRKHPAWSGILRSSGSF